MLAALLRMRFGDYFGVIREFHSCFREVRIVDGWVRAGCGSQNRALARTTVANHMTMTTQAKAKNPKDRSEVTATAAVEVARSCTGSCASPCLALP